MPGSSRTAKNNLDIRSGTFDEVSFEWTPERKGDIILRLEIEAEDDLNLENNIIEINYYVFSNAPDIEVWIDVERRLRVNERTEIRIILSNNGPKDAENVSVVVSSVKDGTISEINKSYVEKANGYWSLDYFIEWTPVEVGEYILEAVAEVEGDDNLNNNRGDRFVNVLPDAPDVTGHYNWEPTLVIINQPSNLSFKIFNQGFRVAENINVSLFEIINNDELIGSSIIDSLLPEEIRKILFEWTPISPGYKQLKLVVETKNDADPANDIYPFSLGVLSDNVDIIINPFLTGSNLIINKDNLIEFGMHNSGGRTSDEIFVSLSFVHIEGEETLLYNRSHGFLNGDSGAGSGISYTPDEVGIKEFKIRAITENDYDLSNNEGEFLMKVVPQSKLINLGSNALSGYLSLEIQRENLGKWEPYAVLIDDQSKGTIRTLNGGESLALDELFNELEYSISISDKGSFRVYVAFLDENRSIIETYDGKKLEASYQFIER